MYNLLSMRIFFFLFLSASAFSSEKSIYSFKWMDEQDQLFVLQKKQFPKKSTLLLSTGYISSSLSDFQESSGQNFDLSYFMLEEWGLNIGYSKYNNSDNEGYDSVRSQTTMIPFVRRFLSKTYLNILYSPFYGKLNTYNWIYYLDFSLGLGLSSIQTEDNRDSFLANSPLAYTQQSYNGANLLMKLNFYITKRIYAVFTFDRTYFSALRPTGDSKFNYYSQDYVFSLGFRY